jgi:hypothetical protein
MGNGNRHAADRGPPQGTSTLSLFPSRTEQVNAWFTIKSWQSTPTLNPLANCWLYQESAMILCLKITEHPTRKIRRNSCIASSLEWGWVCGSLNQRLNTSVKVKNSSFCSVFLRACEPLPPTSLWSQVDCNNFKYHVLTQKYPEAGWIMKSTSLVTSSF